MTPTQYITETRESLGAMLVAATYAGTRKKDMRRALRAIRSLLETLLQHPVPKIDDEPELKRALMGRLVAERIVEDQKLIIQAEREAAESSRAELEWMQQVLQGPTGILGYLGIPSTHADGFLRDPELVLEHFHEVFDRPASAELAELRRQRDIAIEEIARIKSQSAMTLKLAADEVARLIDHQEGEPEPVAPQITRPGEPASWGGE